MGNQEGDARHEEQHKRLLVRHLLHDLQAGIGITRTAGHNQFATVVALLHEILVGS